MTDARTRVMRTSNSFVVEMASPFLMTASM